MDGSGAVRRRMGMGMAVALIAAGWGCAPSPGGADGVHAEESMATDGWTKIADGIEFPEGPAWDGDGRVFVSDCRGDAIHVVTDRGSADTIPVPPPARTNGLAFGPDGDLFACDHGRSAIIRRERRGGPWEVHAEGRGDGRFRRPNDLAFAPDGALYVTDPSAYRREDADGRIARIPPGGGDPQTVATDLGFPNGIAFSADGGQLYCCESAWNRVVRFPVGADGSLGDPEVFVELPGGDPDGIAFDEKGRLWVAHFGGGHVYVVGPDGAIDREIAAPGAKPTNLDFGGPDLRTLYLTEVETGGVYSMRTETPGLPLLPTP